MEFLLNQAEARALGSLLEKEMATPEYYPLTLNALVNACNQKSNRDPVTAYDEETVEDALEGLRAKRLAASLSGAGMRVAKHRELLSEALNLGRREMALLCELLVRGPQTTGELHNRCARLHEFSDLEEVQGCLDRLIGREPDPLVAILPRRPGTKEPRYTHLFAGPPESLPEPAPAPREAARSATEERLAALDAEVADLRRELSEFEERFAAFRRQFE